MQKNKINEDTENKSSVSPNTQTGMPPQPLFGEQGKEYLKESANIEDMPDSEDEEAYDEEIEKDKEK